MPRVECGFPNLPNRTGAESLQLVGPTILVQVGFNADLTPIPGQQSVRSDTHFHALIDTGASESFIDFTLAASLQLPFVGTHPIGGVAGLQDHPAFLAYVYIPALNYSIWGRFVAVRLRESNQPHYVLLGRNLLRDCRMEYDGRSGKVVLEIDPTAISQ